MFIGIDPGFKGAISFMNDHKLLIYDLPTTTYNGRIILDGQKLASLIYPYRVAIKLAIIEDVHSMPNQSISAMFRFGYAAGIVHGILDAYRIKTLKIKPSVWKSVKNLDRNKNNSLALAKKIFPEYQDYFRLKKHDGRAESAILAHYANEVFGKS